MAKKMTKIEMFEQILAHTTNEDEKKFLANEIQLLVNKANNKKPTAEQKANEALKAEILDLLNGKYMTASEVWRSNDEWVVKWSVQKFSALINQLEDTGAVTRKVDKRVSYFTATEVEDEVEDDADSEDEGV